MAQPYDYPPPTSDYPPSPPPAAPSSTMAIVSLISGIAGWTVLPVLGAIVAVITGHMAKSEIRDSMGRLSGDGMATAGLVLGYANLALGVLGICALVALLALGVTIPLCFVPWGNIQF